MVFVSTNEVQLVESGSEVSAPYLVNMRPSESIVKDAMDLLTANNCRVNDGNDSSEALVRVGKLGTFTLASMKIFQNMCTRQSDALKLQQERNWLSQEKENLPVIKKIQDILESSRPHDEILRQGFFIIDVHDFSTLACKRYVNGFNIDAVCLKLLHECLSAKVVYLLANIQSDMSKARCTVFQSESKSVFLATVKCKMWNVFWHQCILKLPNTGDCFALNVQEKQCTLMMVSGYLHQETFSL